MAYLSVTASVTERADVRHEAHTAGSWLVVSDGAQTVGLIVTDLATAERLLHAATLLRDSLLPQEPADGARDWRAAETALAAS